MLISKKVADKTYFIISGKPNYRVHKILRKNDWLLYGHKQKVFYFEATRRNLLRFIDEHSHVFIIRINHLIKIEDVEIKKILLEQSYLKHRQYKSCPSAYLKYMYNRNYAENTIEA